MFEPGRISVMFSVTDLDALNSSLSVLNAPTRSTGVSKGLNITSGEDYKTLASVEFGIALKSGP